MQIFGKEKCKTIRQYYGAHFWQGKVQNSSPIFSAFLATESVNSAPSKREKEVQIFGKEKCKTIRQYYGAHFWQGKVQFQRVFGNGKCELSAIQEGRKRCKVLARKSAKNYSPILRCTFLARQNAKLIANFSATKVTSLPSLSLSLSLSLCISLSPLSLSLSLSLTHTHTHTHRAYLTHNIGSASALPIIQPATSLCFRTSKRKRLHYRKRGSASYIVREVLLVREREREIQRERERKTEVTSPLSR